ncbi:Gfo/Idh/MocA family protein [Paenibacillus sp. sgz5001063]|uniref:Gfo/Idh/MocA family protein n=1 Tax=Paenibacillus sp. sgz5001063 TaxID=3242474 RepID=UPI0036D2986B
MSKEVWRVGIIGASMNGSWGTAAHLPALQALPNFKVTAISTTRQASADETAERYGIPNAFTDPNELARHPDVDLVTVAVKVPEHDKLVRIALEAGKHVFCEFPLGRTTAETANLLQAAESQGVRHFVGLQARANPAVNYVKDLIADGYVGDIRAVHCNYSVPVYPTRSKQIDLAHQYLLEDTHGANVLTITAGHLLDGLMHILGPFSELSAILRTHAAQVQVMETGAFIHPTSPDHVAVQGILANGAVMSSQIRNTYQGNLLLEINGTEGDLLLVSEDNFMFQIDSLVVKGAQDGDKSFKVLAVPAKYDRVPQGLSTGPAYNVAQLYQGINRDLRENTRNAPDFYTAMAIHKLFDQIRAAAETGTRQKL